MRRRRLGTHEGKSRLSTRPAFLLSYLPTFLLSHVPTFLPFLHEGDGRPRTHLLDLDPRAARAAQSPLRLRAVGWPRKATRGLPRQVRACTRRLPRAAPQPTLPYPSSPRLTSPRLTLPRLASPHLTSSYLASPRLASPHLTSDPAHPTRSTLPTQCSSTTSAASPPTRRPSNSSTAPRSLFTLTDPNPNPKPSPYPNSQAQAQPQTQP